MCSNESLESQMISMGKDIQKDFITGLYKDEQINAVFNRIQELIVPKEKNLFLIQKLLKPSIS